MKKILLCFILVMMMMYPKILYGMWEPDNDQKFILDVSRNIGESIGWPETIQAIQFVESTCGVNIYGPEDNNFSNRYFGPSQMKISTARYVIEEIRESKITYTDQQIKTRLLKDDVWAIQLATDYFKYLLNVFKHKSNPWKYAVLAYNRGPGTVKKHGLSNDPHNYLDRVSNTINTIIIPYNKQEKTISSRPVKWLVLMSVNSLENKYIVKN